MNHKKQRPFVLLALAGLALAAVVSAPLAYRALAQSSVDPAAPASGPENFLPTRLFANADGSMSVSFQGGVGAMYQIYYSDGPAAAPGKMIWAVAADDIVAERPGWQVWVDRGETNRPAPGQVQQRYYRVVLKAPASEPAPPPPPLTPAISPFKGLAKSLRLATLEEIAEIGRLAGGGAQTEEELVRKLAQTWLPISKLFEVADAARRAGALRAAQLIYEAILGPRASQATVNDLAKAHVLLGSLHRQAGRCEEAIPHYLQATRLAPKTDWGTDGVFGATFCYWTLGRYEDSRAVLNQLVARPPSPKWRDFGLYCLALSYWEEQKWPEAVAGFTRLDREQTTVYAGKLEMWRAACAKRQQETAYAAAVKAQGAK